MKWFRLYYEILDDPKIKELTNFEFKMFIYLMCLACEKNDSGVLPVRNGCVTDDAVAWRLRVRRNQLKTILCKFETLHLISKNEDGYYITNWNKRQYVSDNINLRVQKHRELKRYKSTNETFDVTLHVTPPDTDTDTDKKEYKERKRFISPTIEEVKNYAIEIGFKKLINNPQSFIDYYQTQDWFLSSGKKMKDWKAGIRTWQNREIEKKNPNNKTKEEEEAEYLAKRLHRGRY